MFAGQSQPQVRGQRQAGDQFGKSQPVAVVPWTHGSALGGRWRLGPDVLHREVLEVVSEDDGPVRSRGTSD